MSDVLAILSKLVSIPSPNPPGDTRGVAEYVHSFLGRAGFSSRLVSPDDQAVSVVAEIGNTDGPTVMYHAHLDTVPVGDRDAWKVDPLAATVIDDKAYGRGAVDDKGILAAMLSAAEGVATSVDRMKGKLVIVAAADEETGGIRGTRYLLEQSLLGQPDFVVIGEQTSNRVAIAHKGTIRAVITVVGRGAHSTNPSNGINAIGKMAKVIAALEKYDAGLRRQSHPLLGPSSLTVATISGGTAANVVPDLCTIEVDRRFVPGENPSEILADLQEILRELGVEDPDLQVGIGQARISDSFETEGTDPHTRRFMETVRELTGGDPGPVGYLPGSDAKFFKRLPATRLVVFGPGSYEVAHSAREHVPLGELHQAEEVLRSFAHRVLLAGE